MSKFYVGKARALRRNMTEAERALWRRLRNKGLGVKFRRQEPIGCYIVDFVCYEKRIVIELDGGQHIESLEDIGRENWLRERRFKVLRFWSNDVLRNIDGVIREIEVEINKVK
jgi:very-short-patch-repair endonuclease